MDSAPASDPGNFQLTSHKMETNDVKQPASVDSSNSVQPMHNMPVGASGVIYFPNSGSRHGQIPHQQQTNSSHTASMTSGLQTQQQLPQQKTHQLMFVNSTPNVDSLRAVPPAFQVPINQSLFNNPRVYPFLSPSLNRQSYPHSQVRPQYVPYPPVVQFVTPSSNIQAQTTSMPGYPTSRNLPEYSSPAPNQQVQVPSRRPKPIVIIDPVTGKSILDDCDVSERASSVSSSGSTSMANCQEDIEAQVSVSPYLSSTAEVPGASLPLYDPLVKFNKKVSSFASSSFNKPVEIFKISSPNLSNSDVLPESTEYCETSDISNITQGKEYSQMCPLPGLPQSKRRNVRLDVIDPVTGKSVFHQDDESRTTSSSLSLNVNARSFEMDSKTVLSPQASVVPVPQNLASSAQLSTLAEAEYYYENECNEETDGYGEANCDEEIDDCKETEHDEAPDVYEETECNQETDDYKEAEHGEKTDGCEEIECYEETFPVRGSPGIEAEIGHLEVGETPCLKTYGDVEETTANFEFPHSVHEDSRDSTSSFAHKQAAEMTTVNQTLEGSTLKDETLKSAVDEFENSKNFIQNELKITELAIDEVCNLTDSLKSSEGVKVGGDDFKSIPDNSDDSENAGEILPSEPKTEQLAQSKDQKRESRKKKKKRKKDNEKNIAAKVDKNDDNTATKKDDDKEDKVSGTESTLNEEWQEQWKSFDSAYENLSQALAKRKEKYASWNEMIQSLYLFFEQDLNDTAAFNETFKRIIKSSSELQKRGHMLDVKLKQKTEAVKCLQKEKSALSSLNEELTDKLKSALKQNAEFSSKLKEMEETIAALEKKNESMQVYLKKKDAKIECLVKERSALSATYERQYKMDKHALQEKIRVLEQKLCDLNITIENKEDAYSSIKEELSHLKEGSEKERLKNKQLVKLNDDFICQVSNLRAELNKKNKAIAALEEEKEKLVSKQQENVEKNENNNLKEMTKKLDQLTNQLKASAAELEMKNEMISVLKEEMSSLFRSPEQQLIESVKHITEKTSSSTLPMVITAAIKQALGGSTVTRCVLGQVLHSLLQSKIITPEQCIEGFEPVVELLDVYSSKYPLTQDHLAETLEPIIDGHDLTLSFLKECLLPCIPSVAAGKLVVSILKLAREKKGIYKVFKMWKDCDLKWSYFLPSSTDVSDFLKTEGIEYMEDLANGLPNSESLELNLKKFFNGQSGIEHICPLKDSITGLESENDHQLFTWVETSFEERFQTHFEDIMDPVFIIGLIYVFFKSVISASEEDSKLNVTVLLQRISLIKQYVNFKDKFQHYVILTLAALHFKLSVPEGVISQILNLLLENDIVNEMEVFPLKKDNYSEQEVKDMTRQQKGIEETLAEDS